jgi:hypothetical protein
MVDLRFMGEGPPEAFRCRVYGVSSDDENVEARRRAFVEKLAGDGVIDAPAHDEWIAELVVRGWLEYSFESAPGGGRHKRWNLNARGRECWDQMKEQP